MTRNTSAASAVAAASYRPSLSFAALLAASPGWAAGTNPTARHNNDNTGRGSRAPSANLNISGDGAANTAFGHDALTLKTTGAANTATVHSALYYNTLIIPMLLNAQGQRLDAQLQEVQLMKGPLSRQNSRLNPMEVQARLSASVATR
jgi:hypothetical protein